MPNEPLRRNLTLTSAIENAIPRNSATDSLSVFPVAAASVRSSGGFAAMCSSQLSTSATNEVSPPATTAGISNSQKTVSKAVPSSTLNPKSLGKSCAAAAPNMPFLAFVPGTVPVPAVPVTAVPVTMPAEAPVPAAARESFADTTAVTTGAATISANASSNCSAQIPEEVPPGSSRLSSAGAPQLGLDGILANTAARFLSHAADANVSPAQAMPPPSSQKESATLQAANASTAAQGLTTSAMAQMGDVAASLQVSQIADSSALQGTADTTSRAAGSPLQVAQAPNETVLSSASTAESIACLVSPDLVVRDSSNSSDRSKIASAALSSAMPAETSADNIASHIVLPPTFITPRLPQTGRGQQTVPQSLAAAVSAINKQSPHFTANELAALHTLATDALPFSSSSELRQNLPLPDASAPRATASATPTNSVSVISPSSGASNANASASAAPANRNRAADGTAKPVSAGSPTEAVAATKDSQSGGDPSDASLHKSAATFPAQSASVQAGPPQPAAVTVVDPAMRETTGQPASSGSAHKPGSSAPAGSSDWAATASAAADSPSPPGPGPVQMAQIVNKATQSEMRIGLNTSAFGNVEVRAVVHANEVGVLIGSEKGDLRALLSNELPGIANILQQQNLRLNQVNFHHGFAFSNPMSSGGDSQPRSFASKAMAAPAAPAPNTEIAHGESGEPALPQNSRYGGGISILA